MSGPTGTTEPVDAGHVRIGDHAPRTARETLRRGLEVSPAIVRGIGLTAVLAVVAAAGRILVPLVVQQVVDTGILGPGGPDPARVAWLVGAAAVGLLIAGACTTIVNTRLVKASEAGLAQLRVRAFRRVHDLSTLTQGTERRGSLVSRVTSDVDTISFFVQWGGIMLVVSVLQILAATVLMLAFSWQLTLVVYLCFLPLVIALGPAQKRVSAAYAAVRERFGAMLGAISESIVGAETIRAYGVGARTQRRTDRAVRATRSAMVRAQVLVSGVFSAGVLVANLVLAAVVVVGTHLGLRGEVTVGTLLAFVFLVQLFTGPVQLATEILNELQNALAGWRRVLGVVDTPIDVPEPELGTPSPHGPAHVELRGVEFSYPDGPPVVTGVDLTLPAGKRVAVVGATGSGKTTLARLVTRLVDPTRGAVLLDGMDLRELATADLRARVVLVPQEGFLFDGTITSNVAYGARGAAPDDAAVTEVFADLGLADWLADLPGGVGTDVGQRGERLSVGERQLVALARAHLAGGDLLVLDEATSAVDPATEVRIARALERLTAGRTTMTIAHRLSTAEQSDLVVVVDAGRVVEVGTHAELVGAGGRYAAMHAAWLAQTR